MNTQILQFNPQNTRLCAQEILAGGVVAFPTETVYGLGANALCPSAVKKIYEAKGRPSDNPLICHVASKEQIGELAFVTPTAAKLIEAFMPGPITIVLPKKPIVPSVVTGGLGTVGIRMPDHKCALEFIRASGVPLCAPSANTSTKPSPTTAAHVYNDLHGKIRYILDGGECKVGLESTIVDCTNNVLLRKGGIPAEEIEMVIGKLGAPRDTGVALCPGMKYRHYSPDAKVVLAMPGLDMADRIARAYDDEDCKRIILTMCGDYGNRNSLSVGDTVRDYAHKLFAAFRTLDAEGYELIICEGVPDEDVGAALMNRLVKASGGNII